MEAVVFYGPAILAISWFNGAIRDRAKLNDEGYWLVAAKLVFVDAAILYGAGFSLLYFTQGPNEAESWWMVIPVVLAIAWSATVLWDIYKSRMERNYGSDS